MIFILTQTALISKHMIHMSLKHISNSSFFKLELVILHFLRETDILSKHLS